MTMDNEYSLQDVVRCHLCDSPGPPIYCDICHIHLCKSCVGDHLSDESTEHKVVSLKKRGLNPKCSKHPTQLCDLYCEKCDIPICLECVSSREHLGHEQMKILKLFDAKREALHRDLQELENSIFPNYQDIESNIPVQKADLNKNIKKLKVAINRYGEALHKEIDTVIEKLNSDVDEMESKHLAFLNEQEHETKRRISEITQSIAGLNKLLNSNDVSRVSGYKSRNDEFRRLLAKLSVSLPSFTPQKINKDQIYQQSVQQFSLLSSLSIKTERGYTMDSPGAKSSPPDRLLLDVPPIITDFNTEYEDSNEICSVSCLSDDEVWTCGEDNTMRLYNIHGKLVKSIQTKSKKNPSDIAVTQSGELVYTDCSNMTMNLVNNTQIQTMIRLRGSRPLNVCSTSSGDLLVVMENDEKKEVKVVRYSNFEEKQTIQYDNKGELLFLLRTNINAKYISENKNLDICLADYEAEAVKVITQSGKLRFTYNGSPSTTKEMFRPVGIITDSQGRILTSDQKNHCIHILGQDGQFLRYIDNCDLKDPYGLCVDTKDNLFVAEWKTGKVKKIQYYM